MTTYKEAGVDYGRKADALERVRTRIARTGRPEVIGGIGGFGGLFRSPGEDRVLVATTDGVGTKLEVARLMDRHEVVGADIVNLCVNDALAMGAEPLFFLDYFSTTELQPGVFERVVGAMADACAAHGCALLGGETAQMPGMYAPGVYDLAGFLVGAVERSRLLDPASVREGDALVGLPSSGLHTNGYSLARLIVARIAEREGASVEEVLRGHHHALGGSLGDALLAPHRSYLEAVRALRKVAAVRSIAHITGGGWEENLPRALPPHLRAAVDRDEWAVPPLFTLLGDAGGVAEAERWDTWNMGVGLVAIVAAEDALLALKAVPDAVIIGAVERARSGERRVRYT